MRAPPSPCNRICRIVPETGLCAGCKRTLSEIQDWPMLSPERQRALLKALEKRS